jgi:hypothetical protein
MRTWIATAVELLSVSALLLAACVAGCTTTPEPAAPDTSVAPAATGKRVLFEFVALDGRTVSTSSMSGRFSVIAFGTSYDIASQAQAKFLLAVAHRHAPRVNAALLVLEREDNRPMIEAFAGALKLDYPVAIADAATIAGNGPFAGLHHVPSVVILDREGREIWRHVGLADEDTIRAALVDVQRAER